MNCTNRWIAEALAAGEEEDTGKASKVLVNCWAGISRWRNHTGEVVVKKAKAKDEIRKIAGRPRWQLPFSWSTGIWTSSKQSDRWGNIDSYPIREVSGETCQRCFSQQRFPRAACSVWERACKSVIDQFQKVCNRGWRTQGPIMALQEWCDVDAKNLTLQMLNKKMVNVIIYGTTRNSFAWCWHFSQAQDLNGTTVRTLTLQKYGWRATHWWGAGQSLQVENGRLEIRVKGTVVQTWKSPILHEYKHRSPDPSTQDFIFQQTMLRIKVCLS